MAQVLLHREVAKHASGLVACPHGHPCFQRVATESNYAVNDWNCDSCRNHGWRNEVRHVCVRCVNGTDYCFSCVPRRWFLHTDTPVYAAPGRQHALGNAGLPLKNGDTVEQLNEEGSSNSGWAQVRRVGTQRVLGWMPLMATNGIDAVASLTPPGMTVTPTGQHYAGTVMGAAAPSLSSFQLQSQTRAVMTRVNEILKAGPQQYRHYSCKVVSWDDASRGTVGGGLSSLGSNITDTYLVAKTAGTRLFTIRSGNWNEKLGCLSTKDVALVAGHTLLPAAATQLKPVTLANYLKNIGAHGAYAGLAQGLDLSSPALDDKVSIRFQTTFLPVGTGPRGTLEFTTESYNYQTRSNRDPKNLLLLCTTQGAALQQDGPGKQRLFHHALTADKTIERHFLEAETTRHKVGGAQTETAAERKVALDRGKAVSSVIGTRAMGTRFNVLLTVQIPLKQAERPSRGYGGGYGSGYGSGSGSSSSSSDDEKCCVHVYGNAEQEKCSKGASFKRNDVYKFKHKHKGRARGGARGGRAEADRGRATAARVSRGSKHDVWDGLTKKDPLRHPSQHITVTAVIYHTIAGGVPTDEDVQAAVQDMENLYASCTGGQGQLAGPAFDFMKKELTVAEQQQIVQNVPPPTSSWPVAQKPQIVGEGPDDVVCFSSWPNCIDTIYHEDDGSTASRSNVSSATP
jgi:hypothetical protein